MTLRGWLLGTAALALVCTAGPAQARDILFEGSDEVACTVPDGYEPSNWFGLAIIIVNNDYENLTDVQFALNDARAACRLATEGLGFDPSNVRVYRDLTRTDMLRLFGGSNGPGRSSISGWVSSTRDDTDLFVYYSGHGMPPWGEGVDQTNSEAFLMPVDGSAEQVADTGYPLSRLYNHLSQIQPRNTLVVLDACFSGKDRRGESIIQGVKSVPFLPPPPKVPEGLTAFAAAGAGQVANEDPEREQGLFTATVVQGITEAAADHPRYSGNGDGKVSLGELETYLELRMTRQTDGARFQRADLVSGPGVPQGSWQFAALTPEDLEPAPPPEPEQLGPSPEELQAIQEQEAAKAAAEAERRRQEAQRAVLEGQAAEILADIESAIARNRLTKPEQGSARQLARQLRDLLPSDDPRPAEVAGDIADAYALLAHGRMAQEDWHTAQIYFDTAEAVLLEFGAESAELRQAQGRLAAIQEDRRQEQERLAAQRAEQERLAALQAERDRLAREQAERERAERERLAAIEAEKQRVAEEQARVEAERAEKERLAALQAEQAEGDAARAERERLAALEAEQDRLKREEAEEVERAEQERLAAVQAEQDRRRREEEARRQAAAEAEERDRAASLVASIEGAIAGNRLLTSSSGPSAVESLRELRRLRPDSHEHARDLASRIVGRYAVLAEREVERFDFRGAVRYADSGRQVAREFGVSSERVEAVARRVAAVEQERREQERLAARAAEQRRLQLEAERERARLEAERQRAERAAPAPSTTRRVVLPPI